MCTAAADNGDEVSVFSPVSTFSAEIDNDAALLAIDPFCAAVALLAIDPSCAAVALPVVEASCSAPQLYRSPCIATIMVVTKSF